MHERETTSSGRPKAKSLHQEDADFYYTYDRRGGLKSKRPKSNLEKYAYWYKHNVKFAKGTGDKSFTCQRLTPLTPFESAIGVRSCIPSYRYHWCIKPRWGCQERMFTEDEWKIFQQTHTIDYGNLEVIYSKDFPQHLGQGEYDWKTYFTDKANKLNLEVVNINELEFREKQKPAVIDKIPTPSRPNPKEVKPVEEVEVKPVEEVEKYSPLIIAGVIAVVVILLLKRRRA